MKVFRISLVLGDITKQRVDAIVNAANTTLLGGGGVDGAIHATAGTGLRKACKELDGCAIGEAKITKGYKLPARFVIHTVGPVWNDGKHNEDVLLAACCQNSLKLAVFYGLKTIAFPAISTGAYRFPLERATHIAIAEVMKFLKKDIQLENVLFVCFTQDTYDTYQQVFKEYRSL